MEKQNAECYWQSNIYSYFFKP